MEVFATIRKETYSNKGCDYIKVQEEIKHLTERIRLLSNMYYSNVCWKESETLELVGVEVDKELLTEAETDCETFIGKGYHKGINGNYIPVYFKKWEVLEVKRLQ